jgi:hypothetical protein
MLAPIRLISSVIRLIVWSYPHQRNVSEIVSLFKVRYTVFGQEHHSLFLKTVVATPNFCAICQHTYITSRGIPRHAPTGDVRYMLFGMHYTFSQQCIWPDQPHYLFQWHYYHACSLAACPSYQSPPSMGWAEGTRAAGTKTLLCSVSRQQYPRQSEAVRDYSVGLVRLTPNNTRMGCRIYGTWWGLHWLARSKLVFVHWCVTRTHYNIRICWCWCELYCWE